jgi:hypothetical protein
MKEKKVIDTATCARQYGMCRKWLAVFVEDAEHKGAALGLGEWSGLFTDLFATMNVLHSYTVQYDTC